MFRFPFTVLFGQVDAVGITFFSRSFETCHAAFEAMLEAGGLPLATVLSERDWAAPLVHADADFKRPMKLGEHLVAEMTVHALTGGTITFAYRLVDADGRARASVKLVHAFIERARFKSRRAPPEFLEVLARAGLTLPA